MIRWLALAFGLSNIMAAIGGFTPGITQPVPAGSPDLSVVASYGLLLGLYPINALHNLVHLVLGLGGLWAARDLVSARQYWLIAGVALLLLTVLGAIPATQTLGGLLPLYGHDVWLHGLEALLAFGLVWRAAPKAVPDGW